MTKLPPIASRCDVCNNDSRRGGDGPLLRCSACKDHFYCSAACQAQEWKEHKYRCSVLPPEGLQHVEIENDKEREKAIRDFGVLLHAWTEQSKKCKNGVIGGQRKFSSAKHVAAKALIRFTYPDKLQYKRRPSSRSKYPYRSTLMLAARMGLIQLVSKLEPDEQDLLAERIDRAKIPTVSRLFGTKVMRRPDSLSPGEYEVIGTLGSSFLLYGNRDELSPVADDLPMEDKDFWFMLSGAFQELWDAPNDFVDGFR